MARPEKRPWTGCVLDWEAAVGQSPVRIERYLPLPYVILLDIPHTFLTFAYQYMKSSSVNDLWRCNLFLYRSFLWLRGVHLVSSVCGWWRRAGAIHGWVLLQWHQLMHWRHHVINLTPEDIFMCIWYSASTQVYKHCRFTFILWSTHFANGCLKILNENHVDLIEKCVFLWFVIQLLGATQQHTYSYWSLRSCQWCCLSLFWCHKTSKTYNYLLPVKINIVTVSYFVC